MQIPKKCPKCGDPLLVEHMTEIRYHLWRGMCARRLDHKFSVFYYMNVAAEFIDKVDYMSIRVFNNINVTWDFIHKRIAIGKENIALKNYLNSTQYIPYFEPDLSNYDKLVSKLKTYVIFS